MLKIIATLKTVIKWVEVNALKNVERLRRDASNIKL